MGGMSYFGHKFRLNQWPFRFILITGKVNTWKWLHCNQQQSILIEHSLNSCAHMHVKNLYESCTKLNRAVEKLCKTHMCVVAPRVSGPSMMGKRSEQIDALWWPPPNQQNQCPARASLLLMIVSSTLIVQAFLTAQMNFDHYFGLFALSFFSLSLSFSILSILSLHTNICKILQEGESPIFLKNTKRKYQSQGTSWVGGRPMFVTMWVGMCDKCVLGSKHCDILSRVPPSPRCH